MGPVFSRQSAPGILLGVGNVGPYLKDREDGDTFYSKDGGLSWKCARPGPHKYVLGDMGSILVLAEDKKEVKRIIYSFDQGQHWNEKKLNAAITPVYLTTEKLSSSQSVILLGEKKDDSYVLYHFDFSKAHPRKCKFDEKRLEDSKDFEVWQPKSKIRNNNNKQDKLCIMGSELKYFRRKPEVECYIGEKFKIFKSSKEKCPCTESDFECDYNYILNEDGKCELHGEILIPKGECKKKSDKFMASSGYRKIPGNNCDEKAKGAVKLNQKIEKSCNITDNTITIPNNGKVRHQRKEFSHSILNYYIFPKSEVYMIYTINGELWTSLDKGTSWRKKIDEKVIKIIGHPYDKLTAFVITKDQNIYLTKDQGKTFDKFSLPLSMSTFNTNQILSFNSNKKETILFIGSTECPKCHSEAFISNDYGKTWKSISKYVRNCEFGITSEFTPENKNLIFCSIYNNMDINIDQSKLELVKDPNHPLDLYTIDSQDITKKNVILKDIGQFTISGIYLIASSYKKEQLLIKVAKSNLKFSDAKFPPMMEISSDGFIIHESENSDGSSIMLTLSKVSFENTTTPTFGISQLPIGSLFTSNFDGTAYSLSLPDLRVSSKGIVDLEQVLGIQGMILANQVTSMDENKNPIAKTVISYDNGATWNYIQPPKKGINGKEYDCLELGCSLHLHTIYENHQQLGSFGNQNSKGHMIAVGNVGQTLLPYEECQTYLTLDNGITWNEIKASESLYAIGDSGSILVLVDDEAPTNTLIYSLDGGKNWNKYIFSNDPIKPTHLLTASSGESLRFLIIGFSSEHDNSKASAGHKSQIVTVDFSELFERKCEFDELKWKDFEKWTPERIVSYKDNKATTSKCLLGSKLSLWRKKIGTNCYVGENSHSKEINMESCECNEQDYECDVNYWRSEMGFGECLLFGKDPDRPKDCKRGEKYKAKSGYRKIATSHCKGGKDLSQSIEKECLDFNGIDMKQTTFDSEMAENFYFRESFTIVIRTNDGEVHISKNEGYSFHKLIDKEHDKIISAMHHTYIDNTAYFVTLSNTHYYTHDETLTINSFKTPTEPNGFSIPFFSFHPEEPSWAIFTGTKGCDKNPSDSCRAEAYLTKDNGATWKSLGDYVRNCQFAKTKHLTNVPKERILCETYKDRSGSQSMFVSNPVLLKYSDDDFETSKTLFENIIGFSFFYEFMVVAESDPDFKGNLILNVSKDVEHFEHGRFPLNLTIASDGFTVLESNTHSLFLHITSPGQGYGPLLISDSNGTQFTKSLDNLNRDDDGFVDFEKMAGIEGVALANQVFNSEEVKLTKIKKIQSRITFNNGNGFLLCGLIK
ncbi:Oligoxyloglucan reducing end-specific cellobiohydrolase [Neoconidiobolus thromboides FSU 785]|nr:Oligoxyloglucan reducing end-specific cellobiohydrolase [Neoconidiobolus thromboides FSU 785]